ncbi:hypothetical protein GCM10027456_75240 [Kineosporia babensis]
MSNGRRVLVNFKLPPDDSAVALWSLDCLGGRFDIAGYCHADTGDDLVAHELGDRNPITFGNGHAERFCDSNPTGTADSGDQ